MKKFNLYSKLILGLSAFAGASTITYAGIGPAPTPVPEPSMLPLLAVGAVIMFIVKKRKK
ncbi:MAG: hypothetical protein COB35_07145 [Gammaproteobacteria bacterium]|nr:MAG: hypothetical protein COB35_07145 [Gammaproteobacteria bacterium]